MPPTPITFAAGQQGQWRIDAVIPVAGESLPAAERLSVGETAPPSSAWALRGVGSNQRYTFRNQADALMARQAGLGRPDATRAVLIPMRKSAAWWALAQDERHALFGDHIGIGLDYLPAVARRLLHSRDMGERFDFLTWFEFAPEHASDFNHMLVRLRSTAEWRHVDREVEVRLKRA